MVLAWLLNIVVMLCAVAACLLEGPWVSWLIAAFMSVILLRVETLIQAVKDRNPGSD